MFFLTSWVRILCPVCTKIQKKPKNLLKNLKKLKTLKAKNVFQEILSVSYWTGSPSATPV